MESTALQSERIEVADDLWAVNAFFEEKGWTDGLPIIPPTEERVAQMLSAVQRGPQDVIGVVPPRWAPATVEKIAINAVMAGCLPQYMPRPDRGRRGFDRSEAESLRASSNHGGTGDHVDRKWPDSKTTQY